MSVFYPVINSKTLHCHHQHQCIILIVPAYLCIFRSTFAWHFSEENPFRVASGLWCQNIHLNLNLALERYHLVYQQMLDVLIFVHLHHVLVHPLLVSTGHSTDVANDLVIIDLDPLPVCGLCELVLLPAGQTACLAMSPAQCQHFCPGVSD